MKFTATTVLALCFGGMATTASAAGMAAEKTAPAASVRGAYIEARSLSVYAGACHYNGELTTAGREAILAWRFDGGAVDGVDLSGVRALAVVAGADNLGLPNVSRRSVLYVDAAATPAQRAAAAKLLKARIGATLGTVAAVKSAPLTFAEEGKSVSVRAPGVADLKATRYPCAHCRMPAETWYGPLTASKSEVAQGISTGFSDKTLGVSWSQSASDNVYVGTFEM